MLSALPGRSDRKMPILQDLYDELLRQPGQEAKRVTAAEGFSNSSLNVFNHRTNVELENHRLVCFNIKDSASS